ncbi:MAG: hypothetical protein QM783_20455 [Phycisphaerales bacterium]
MNVRNNANLVPLLATFAVTVLLIAFGGLRYNGFASFGNLVSVVNDGAVIGIAALGATFVILSGGIDLSTGALIAFTSTLTASLIEHHGLHPAAAVGVSLCAGAAAGLGAGSLIHFFQLPPFMVTLAAMFFWRAMGFVIEPQSVSVSNASVLDLAGQSVGIAGLHLPLISVAYALLTVVAIILAGYTGFGRGVYAIGGNEQSARLMGVPIARTKLLTYTIAGLCSAAAGVAATIYKCSGDPAGFVGGELDVIAAVVIGGTLLSGGVGYVAGTVLGVLILGLIQAIINFEGNLSAAWVRIATGALVLFFVLLQKGVARLGHARLPAAQRTATP